MKNTTGKGVRPVFDTLSNGHMHSQLDLLTKLFIKQAHIKYPNVTYLLVFYERSKLFYHILEDKNGLNLVTENYMLISSLWSPCNHACTNPFEFFHISHEQVIRSYRIFQLSTDVYIQIDRKEQ